MSQINVNTTLSLPSNQNAVLQDNILDLLDLIFNCGVLHLLSLTGVVTNICNALVIYRYGLRETTSILLFSLSVSDLLCSVLQPARRLHCIVGQFDPVLAATVRSYGIVYLFPLPDIFVSISVLHTTFIAVERLAAVCFPLQVSRMFTPRRVKWLVLISYLYVAAFMAPTLLFFNFGWSTDAITNRTVGIFTLSKFYKDNYDSLNQFTNLGLTNLLITSTLGTTVICSMIIGFKISVGRRNTLAFLASTNATKQVKDMRVIKMLLTVCVVNAAVSLPTVAINLFLLYSNTLIQSTGKLYYLLRSFICVLYQLNACVNFVIYITMSSKFASTLNAMFRCR